MLHPNEHQIAENGAAIPACKIRRLKRGIAVSILAVALLSGCRLLRPPASAGAPGAPDTPDAPEPLPVKKVPEELVVAAWSEPAKLPPAGGQTQILVRVQKRGGAPYAGVEVRLSVSGGSLYSGGKILLTDGRGMTRDRLTAHRAARITLNAGGTRYSFQVPLTEPKAEE